ncbi:MULTISPECIES: hypothetical protein [unclassified Micromonospora]|uniref:hypothetical protein n=1 Tax=unclassified Micromonospora TaxID=2617518 RepID=UPI00331A408E
MSVDHLPARTTTAAATDLPEIHIYFDEATNPVVLNEADVHRDRTQDAYDASVIGAGVIGTAAAFAHAYSHSTLLNNTLIGVTVALVLAAMLLRWAVTREGRKWVYADTDEPYDGDPAATP